MLGALCHDLGKPSTTRFEDGRIRSRGHEEAGVPPTLALLDRWNVHTLLGYDVRAQVLALVAPPPEAGPALRRARARLRRRDPPAGARSASRTCSTAWREPTASAGRPGVFEPVAMEWFRDKVRQLDVAERPPEPLLLGRDVLALGVAPGPRVGEVLRAVYERQLDGAVTTVDEARAEARRLLGS